LPLEVVSAQEIGNALVLAVVRHGCSLGLFMNVLVIPPNPLLKPRVMVEMDPSGRILRMSRQRPSHS
jgi:hypothetical protein